MKKLKIKQKVVALVLAVVMLLQPFYGIKILAEGETPTPSEVAEPTIVPEVFVEPTPTPTVEAINENTTPIPTPSDQADVTQGGVQPTVTPGNEAVAGTTDSTTVTDNNEATVDNNVDASSNTGGNVIIEPTPTATESALPTVELIPTTTEGPTTTPVVEEIPSELTAIPTPGSQNTSEASSDNVVTATNNNDAKVVNFSDSSANTGANTETGKDSTIKTEDATADANVVNFVNTNLVGADFWQLVINMFASSSNDIDLTKIEGYQSFDPALLSVLAKNDNTGDGTINIALANFLSSYSVYNTNNAQLTNNVSSTANTGDNNVEGKRSEIQTGDASAETNVFNLVNTNLVGNEWFFSIINLFKEQNGDLILPYELQYLLGDAANNGGNVTAINQDTGENSQNQAIACSVDSTTINNNNQADIDNNINVSSNTGNNTIVSEDGSIKTGNAQSLVDLLNVVNTNIYGSRWLLLQINNFGNWSGDVLGWWGNKITIGNTTYIWIKLPDGFQPTNQADTTAVNQDTGENSQNQAIATQTTSLEVVNNNTACVTNNINVEANTGNNQIEGKHSEINTGNASAVANVSNVVNTNIIGNNWFFGVINIFGDFFGNIIFPRPDLQAAKIANKQFVTPGEEVTYTLYYRDAGRLWAKNVVIEDNLPPGLTYLSSSNNGVLGNNKIVWKFDQINSGDSGSVTVVAKVNSNVSDGTHITNCVNVSTGTDEPNKDNNSSCAEVLITGNPSDPTITPTQTPQPTPTQSEGGGGMGGEGQDQALGTSSNGQSGNGGTTSCTPPEAPKAPNLLSSENISSTEVKLTWTKVDRATYYLVSYGDFPGHYLYGSPNVGDVDSYVVGSLNSGQTYYFVVSAVIGGDCPVAGPYSNELSNGRSTSGVLGTSTDFNVGPSSDIESGGLESGVSIQSGEVAGAQTKGACPVWWIALVGQTVLLGGFYGYLFRKKQLFKRWWLVAPALVAAGYLADRYAHTHLYSPSSVCHYEFWLGALAATVETAGFKLLRNRV